MTRVVNKLKNLKKLLFTAFLDDTYFKCKTVKFNNFNFQAVYSEMFLIALKKEIPTIHNIYFLNKGQYRIGFSML